VCLLVHVSVYLFLMRGHSFVPICTKFGTLHPYILRMVTGISERRSRPRADAPHAADTPLQVTADRGHITSGAQN